MISLFNVGGALCQVYYKAEILALRNGRDYHVAAILRRGKSTVKIGANVNKTHPRFDRVYSDGSHGAHMHAEMNVLRFSKPGDTIEVIRFRKCDHSRTMAKPCSICVLHMRRAGIKKIRYTDWEGNWQDMTL